MDSIFQLRFILNMVSLGDKLVGIFIARSKRAIFSLKLR
jgi:hypothetical protein